MHGVHLFLRIHPESGVWLLSVSDHCTNMRSRQKIGQPLDTVLCTHQPLLFNDKRIKHSEERCLSEATFTLQIADLSYHVQFKVMYTHQEDSYIHQRNLFLAAMKVVAPPALISGIPFPDDHRNQLARWRNPVASGAFGAVYLGFDPVTGSLKAIKAWNCKRPTEVSKVMQEISATATLSDLRSEGIIRMFGWRNGLSEEVQRDPPVDFYLILESGLGFNKVKWSALSTTTPQEWSERKVLFRQLLVGLKTVHAQGWIHRDITSQNIILVPSIPGLRPATAKLADFGKLCTTPEHTNEHLAARKYRAPEVDGKRTYKQSIDIWGLGLAIAYSWFVRPRQQMNRQ